MDIFVVMMQPPASTLSKPGTIKRSGQAAMEASPGEFEDDEMG
jgi:hypothetical protein